MTMDLPVAALPPGRWRRAGRYLLRIVLVLAVLVAPTLAYHVIWTWPRQVLPEVTAAQEQQRASAGLEAARAERLMALVRDARRDSGLPSLSAAVARVDGVAWAGASGWADIGKGRAATVASRYRTGSIAKPITTAALMRLHEAGRIDLDAPGSAAVSGLPPALASLTARQLASHTGGVRHYSPWPRWWPGWHEASSQRHYPSVEAGMALFADDPLRFAPGTDFQYSTFGYALLSRLLEGAAGQPFPRVLREQVFAPAGMADTAVDTPEPMPGRVAFYAGAGGRYTLARRIDSSFRIAGGGLVATPTDLARLGIALQRDDLVSAPGRTALWTPQPLLDGSANPQGYGLGWRSAQSTRLFLDGRPLRVVHHGGTQTGAAAFLLLLPEQGLAIAVMSNSMSGREQVQETAQALAREALRWPAAAQWAGAAGRAAP